MTEQELKSLGRKELIEIIYEMKKTELLLREHLGAAEQQLADRRIVLENEGSIADAALKLSGIFECAQQAANDYLREIEEKKKDAETQQVNTKVECDTLLDNANKEAAARRKLADETAENTIRQAEEQADVTVSSAKAEAAALMEDANDKAAAILAQAESAVQKLQEEAEATAAACIAAAEAAAADCQKQAEEKRDAMIADTERAMHESWQRFKEDFERCFQNVSPMYMPPQAAPNEETTENEASTEA